MFYFELPLVIYSFTNLIKIALFEDIRKGRVIYKTYTKMNFYLFTLGVFLLSLTTLPAPVMSHFGRNLLPFGGMDNRPQLTNEYSHMWAVELEGGDVVANRIASKFEMTWTKVF